MTAAAERRNLMDDMAVDVPEAELGDVRVERFEVTRDSLENLRLAFQGGRDCRPGTYTRLMRRGTLWMSDTTAERRDHMGAAMAIAGNTYRNGEGSATRVLIGGLGLGMIVRVALLTPSVKHVDVVDIDPTTVALVGPHYEAMAAERGIDLTLHTADMYDIKWPVGTKWDVGWFDIWPDMSTDTLDEMTPLMRSYARRCTWLDCWGRSEMKYHRDRERRSGSGGWF